MVGGLAGTGLRFAIDTLVPHTDSSFPLSTLVVNALGAFALGLLVSRVWPTAPGWLRAGLGAGVLGSFTTFSAFAVSLVSLGAAGERMLALAYLAATLVLGFAAAALGLRLGRRGRTPIDLEDE
ncbi:fluoride efflux transporter CrcB [soil metagenome]